MSFFLISFCFSGDILAQQDAQFTQYMYNFMLVNPAYAGARESLSAAVFHRSQWLGVEGAPVSQSINLHSPYRKNLAMGISIVNEEIGKGIVQESSADLAFAYHIQLAGDNKLSLGVNGGFSLFTVNFSELIGFIDEAGNLANIDKKFIPNFGAGVFWYGYNYYLGMSMPKVLKTKHFDDSKSQSSYIATETLITYFKGGYVWYLSEILKLKPTIMLKYSKGAPLQTDVSLNANYLDRFTLGIAYRWDTAMSAMLGFQLNSNIMLGFAYDRETTTLGNTIFNKGSFEVFLRYEMIRNKGEVMAPRFF
ncbi:MAG: type IX secretion system membrane protein PorP/SprF [Flavobacteriaceae bacterium]|nr:type IX secretion system membrane protein PorP/SprF [Flavobacteriaceae bacterium]